MQSLCTLRDHCRQWPRNTRYQADATPYLGRTSTGWIAPACGWRTHSITSSARASMVVELLAKVPIAASLGRIGPIPAHVDRPRRRYSIGGDDGAQCDTVKDGPVVRLLDPWPHRPHDRGGFHSHSTAPAHRDMGPTGCDASMSNCDVPGSDRDASMSGCDVTSSDDASMPNRDVTGHPDISTECGGFNSRYC
jgi:hypothetical protein